MSSETRPCDRIRIERYHLEEGTAEERRETARHLEGCPRCRERLEALVHDKQAYLTAHPFSRFAAEKLERKSAFAWLAGPRGVPVLAGALATLVLVAVLQVPRQGGESAPVSESASAEDGYRAKGGTAFGFHYRRDGKVIAGDRAETFRAGDELQFVYAAGTHPFVALASVDAQGTVSLYRKEADAATASLPAEAGDGKLASFPFSVTLDAAPGGELFVLLLGKEPLAASAVEAWLAGEFDKAKGDLAALQAALKPPAGAAEAKALFLKKAAT